MSPSLREGEEGRTWASSLPGYEGGPPHAPTALVWCELVPLGLFRSLDFRDSQSLLEEVNVV